MNYTDQLQRTIFLPNVPKKIISLVPSQTELLHYLELDNEVVGITKFCVHPSHWHKNKTRVGGTKTLHLDKIRALQPDLIIANKEENTQAEIELLMREFPVWISDIYTLDDMYNMINAIGEIVHKTTLAAQLVHTLKGQFETYKQRFAAKKVAYFIWKEPYMVAANHTFIHHILEQIGFVNVFAHLERYPALNPAQIQAAHPDFIFLSSEPYPFGTQHLSEFQAICPQSNVQIVDGEVFSWYGCRLLHLDATLAKIATYL